MIVESLFDCVVVFKGRGNPIPTFRLAPLFCLDEVKPLAFDTERIVSTRVVLTPARLDRPLRKRDGRRNVPFLLAGFSGSNYFVRYLRHYEIPYNLKTEPVENVEPPVVITSICVIAANEVGTQIPQPVVRKRLTFPCWFAPSA